MSKFPDTTVGDLRAIYGKCHADTPFQSMCQKIESSILERLIWLDHRLSHPRGKWGPISCPEEFACE